MASINDELNNLELEKEKLVKIAKKRTDYILDAILLLMGFQAGFLSYLTFIEYSWDIMEPITYFVTYCANIYAFLYYLMHKKVIGFSNRNIRLLL